MRGRIGWSITAVVLVAAVAACDLAAAPPTADPGADWLHVKAESALTRWATAVAGSGGQRAFAQVGDPTGQVGNWEVAVGENNKLAVMAGQVLDTPEMPAEKPPDGEVRWSDGTTRMVSLTTARDAVTALTGHGGGDCSGCRPVLLTGARLTTGQVDTSHGSATVPVWEFTVEGSAVRLTRVAIDPASMVVLPPWDPIGVPFTLSIMSASGAVDGRDLTVKFIGAEHSADEPCWRRRQRDGSRVGNGGRRDRCRAITTRLRPAAPWWGTSEQPWPSWPRPSETGPSERPGWRTRPGRPDTMKRFRALPRHVRPAARRRARDRELQSVRDQGHPAAAATGWRGRGSPAIPGLHRGVEPRGIRHRRLCPEVMSLPVGHDWTGVDESCPVYADDLITLVGHMVPGRGFVPLGVDPVDVPPFPSRPGHRPVPDEPRATSLTHATRRLDPRTIADRGA